MLSRERVNQLIEDFYLLDEGEEHPDFFPTELPEFETEEEAFDWILAVDNAELAANIRENLIHILINS